MASVDKVDVDTFHKGIQYALESLGESKFGFESTTVSNFKGKSHEGSGNELVDYSVLLVGCGKKSQISQDFQGQIRGKNGQFRGNFARIFKASLAEKRLGASRANFAGKRLLLR